MNSIGCWKCCLNRLKIKSIIQFSVFRILRLLDHSIINGIRRPCSLLTKTGRPWAGRQLQHLSWAGISRPPQTQLPPSFRPESTHGDNGWVSWLCSEQILWLHLFRCQFPVARTSYPATSSGHASLLFRSPDP